MPVIEEKKNDNKTKRIVLIIAYSLLLIATIIGIIFFFYWMGLKSQQKVPNDDTPSEEVIDNTENIAKYNRLLEVLNDEATLNHYDEATELISFHFDATNRFYLVGKNDTNIYDYSIDCGSIGVTLEEAVDYLLENDPNTSMTKVFDRYNIEAVPNSFMTKYVNNNIKHKTVSMNISTKTYVTSTMYDVQSKKVFIIYHQELDLILDNSYTPIEIEKDSSCYPLYRYIATK